MTKWRKMEVTYLPGRGLMLHLSSIGTTEVVHSRKLEFGDDLTKIALQWIRDGTTDMTKMETRELPAEN